MSCQDTFSKNIDFLLNFYYTYFTDNILSCSFTFIYILLCLTKVVQGIDNFFGKDAVDLLETFVELNTKGKRKAIEYTQDLSQINIYRHD